MSISRKLTLATVLAASIGTASAGDIYFNDFDGNKTVGLGITDVGFSNGHLAAAELGAWSNEWSGDFWRNASGRTSGSNTAKVSVLELSGLDSFQTYTTTFTLGLLDTFDGVGNWGPDYVDIFVNNDLVKTISRGNFATSGTPVYSNVDAYNGSRDNSDDLVSLSFAISTQSMTSLIFGVQARGDVWQGGADESWGIDNFSVATGTGTGGTNLSPVPLPAAVWLFGSALAGFAGLRRFGKRSV